MVGRSEVGAVKEDADGSTVSELVTSLKSAFRNASFTRVEEILVSREEKLKKEIEGKNKENKLLLEKLHMEVLEKLKLQKECAELKELASRLREERDGLLKRLEENANDKKEIFELKRKNCELECAKLNAETEVDVCRERLKVLEDKVLCLEKDAEMLSRLDKSGEAINTGIVKDAVVNLALDTNAGKKKVSQETESRLETGKFDSDEKVLSESNPNPSGSSSQRKRTDNRRPLSEEIVEIIDSDDESASSENTRGIVTEGHLNKAHSGKNVAENEPAVQKRTSASSVDVDDSFPIENGKRVKIQEDAPFASPIEHRTPAALNLETCCTGKLDTSLKLSKLLSELGDDSSSSSSSDDEVDLSIDYSAIFRTDDSVYKTLD